MPEGFKGQVKTLWEDNHRDMTLLESFSYTDPSGKEWKVPAGSFLNGATIPPPLWSLVGSPYTGPYRRASVIHDFFVGEDRNPNVTPEERRAADKMFYQACRFDGCTPRLAAILYLGVRTGTWFATHHPQRFMPAANVPGIDTFRSDREVETTFNRLFFRLENELDTLAIDALEQKADEILAQQPAPAEVN